MALGRSDLSCLVSTRTPAPPHLTAKSNRYRRPDMIPTTRHTAVHSTTFRIAPCRRGGPGPICELVSAGGRPGLGPVGPVWEDVHASVLNPIICLHLSSTLDLPTLLESLAGTWSKRKRLLTSSGTLAARDRSGRTRCRSPDEPERRPSRKHTLCLIRMCMCACAHAYMLCACVHGVRMCTWCAHVRMYTWCAHACVCACVPCHP